MSLPIMIISIKYEHDIVLARQRARTIAELLGFDTREQTRIGTAVSEITRNAYKYAGGGEISFLVEGKSKSQIMIMKVSDQGPGIEDLSAIIEGRFHSKTGMGLGLIGAKKLMDYFHLESAPGKGTTVTLGKNFPPEALPIDSKNIITIKDQLNKQTPSNPYEEFQQQNQELLRAMSELKQRQEELEALNRELEETNRGVAALYAELDEKAIHLKRATELKSQFLSNMSHEFRTPLNSIISLSRLLFDRVDGELNVEQEKQVKFVKKAAEELSELINDLLDLARIEAGKITVRPAEFSLENLLSALRGMLRAVLVNPAVELIVEEPQNLFSMFSDESKVSQILRNLIANAIKFTEKGEIRVSSIESADGNQVVFTVSDTGIGIDPQYHDAIFEEYTQLDTPMHKKEKGTGLGLPLARKLAELLGGKITLASEPGIGSTFTVTLPRRYRDFEVAEDEAVAIDVMRNQILVVEDDKTTAALYEKYLKDSGLQVIIAHSLKAARKRLKENLPAAIILDVLLKGEDSWGFITELKSSEPTMNVPVLVVSVLDEHEKGIALGADDFATKPVEREWLLEKLRSVALRTKLEKILIIDDDEVARYLMKGLLADSKYQIMEASGGEAGFELAVKEKPDLIFLDLIMPEVDGFETLVRLKNKAETKSIPVIVVTSKIISENERRILNEKTLTVISKEWTSREAVIQKIREAIEEIIQL